MLLAPGLSTGWPLELNSIVQTRFPFSSVICTAFAFTPALVNCVGTREWYVTS